MTVNLGTDPPEYEMAIDGADHIHLAYFYELPSNNTYNLEHQNLSTGSTSVVANLGIRFDMAISPTTDRPVIAYSTDNHSPPRIAKMQADGTWTTMTLSHLNNRTLIRDIEFNGSTLHVLGEEGIPNSTEFKLSVSKSDGTTWSHTDIASDTAKEDWADMAVDANGDIIVVYMKEDPTPKWLRAATNFGGTWTNTKITQIDAAHENLAQAEVEFSPAGNPTILYYYYDPNASFDPKYRDLGRATLNKGTWQVDYPDTRSASGQYPQFKFDSSGNLYAFYLQGTTYQIATELNGAWSPSQATSDSPPNPPQQTRLKLDSTGRPIVVYPTANRNGFKVLY